MPLNFKVKTRQKENGEFVVMITFKDKNLLDDLINGLDCFKEEYEKYLLREKNKKEMDWAYFSMSNDPSYSDGNRRK